jgi:hypothetical protein
MVGASRFELSPRVFFADASTDCYCAGCNANLVRPEVAHFAPTFGSRPEKKVCYSSRHIPLATSLHGPERRAYNKRDVAKTNSAAGRHYSAVQDRFHWNRVTGGQHTHQIRPADRWSRGLMEDERSHRVDNLNYNCVRPGSGNTFSFAATASGRVGGGESTMSVAGSLFERAYHRYTS